jgi:hypothetical protein
MEMIWQPLKSRQDSLQAQLSRMARANSTFPALKAAVEAQAFAMISEVRSQREIAEMLAELARDGPEVIAEKLKDGQALRRWLAALVVGRKRLHLEKELIPLLTDPSPPVQQAARAALVRLSRGNDFGPLPTATATEVTQSARAWRWWYIQQDPPEPGFEYLPAPQVPEGERSPGRTLEPMSQPQSGQEEAARR